MTTFNKNGQWSLSGNEDSVLFKTNEKAVDTGKQAPEFEKETLDPNSQEAKDFFDALAKSILEGSRSGEVRQPTNQELFGHLEVTEEQAAAAEEEWNNKIQRGYEEAAKPIDPHHENREWGMCKSFRDRLTEEELKKYEKESNDFDKKFR